MRDSYQGNVFCRINTSYYLLLERTKLVAAYGMALCAANDEEEPWKKYKAHTRSHP